MKARILYLLLFLSCLAQAKDRHKLTQSIWLEEKETHRMMLLEGGRNFSIEILSVENNMAKVNVFYPDGFPVLGDYWVSVDLIQDILKKEIESGIKVTDRRDGDHKGPGCCDVVEGDGGAELSAGGKGRSPAIAPGTGIVYADPEPGEGTGDRLVAPRDSWSGGALSYLPEVPERAEHGAALDFTADPPLKSRAVTLPAAEEEEEAFAAPLPRPRPDLPVHAPVPIPRPRPKREEIPLARIPVPRPNPRRSETREEPRVPASRGEAICDAYRAFKAKGVPAEPLRQALLFYAKASKDGRIGANSKYLSIADFSQNSRRKRFYLLNLQNHTFTQEKVSHGSGKGKGNPGDPNHDGMLDSCGGKGSEKTRAGFFKVGDYYFSQHGRYRWPLVLKKPPRNGMKLYGLSPGVNATAASDGYVMHEAKYNSDGNSVMGRSNGCLAFVPGKGAPLMARLRNGSLTYNYAPMCRDQMSAVLRQVPGWRTFCED